MDPKEREELKQKREQLNTLLYELAKKETLFQDAKEKSNIYKKLEDIYILESGKKFRHHYSEFFSVLLDIQEDVELGHVEVLVQNLSILVDGYQAKRTTKNGDIIDISDNIFKLYDHINLEVGRMGYQNTVNGNTERIFVDIKSNMEIFDRSLKDSKEKLEKADNAEKNYITILGIFASIVLTFTGGIAFSTSVLENIDAVSPYRLAAVVIGLAFTLINVVYILVWFIQEINKPDERKVKYPNFMIGINAILIVALGITIYSYVSVNQKPDAAKQTDNIKASISIEKNTSISNSEYED